MWPSEVSRSGHLTPHLKKWLFDPNHVAKLVHLTLMTVLLGGIAYVAMGQPSFATWVAEVARSDV